MPVACSDQLLCGKKEYAAGGRYHMKSSFGRVLVESATRTAQSILGSNTSYPNNTPCDVRVTDQFVWSRGVTTTVSPMSPAPAEPAVVRSAATPCDRRRRQGT